MNIIRKALVLASFVAAVGVLGAVALPAPTANAASCVYYNYSKGDSGSTCVKYIQRMLNGISSSTAAYDADQFGCYNRPAVSAWRLTVDGSFGTNTQSKVYDFQKAFCLGVDGVVGPQTWKQMCWALSGYYHDMSVYGAYAYNDGHNAGRSAGCSRWFYGY